MASSLKRERDELHEINLAENPDRRIWLVKLPKFVHQDFFIHPEGHQLGFVTVDPETKQMKLKVNEPHETLPSTYNLKSSHLQMGMKVFSEDSGGVTFSGTIDAKMDMEPIEGDSQYKLLTKNRSIERNKKTKQTLTTEGISDAVKPSVALSNAKYIIYKKEKNLDKAVPIEKEALLDVLFEAFESKPYWDLKSLITHTRQPQLYLKKVLTEVAIYNKRGPYKSTYEIKPEFFDKRKQEKTDAPSSSSTTTTTTPTSR